MKAGISPSFTGRSTGNTRNGATAETTVGAAGSFSREVVAAWATARTAGVVEATQADATCAEAGGVVSVERSSAEITSFSRNRVNRRSRCSLGGAALMLRGSS